MGHVIKYECYQRTLLSVLLHLHRVHIDLYSLICSCPSHNRLRNNSLEESHNIAINSDEAGNTNSFYILAGCCFMGNCIWRSSKTTPVATFEVSLCLLTFSSTFPGLSILTWDRFGGGFEPSTALNHICFLSLRKIEESDASMPAKCELERNPVED